MSTDPTAAADAAVDNILGGPLVPGRPVEPSRPSVVDNAAPKSEKTAPVPETKNGRNRRNGKGGAGSSPNEADDFFDIDEVPLEDRKKLYVAIQYADGRVEWNLPVGDAAVDKQLGLPSRFITFKSKGGAEQELIDKLLTEWAKALSSPDINAYINLANRYNLFTQLRRYANTDFEPPAAKEDGSYDVEAFKTYVEVSTRKLGSVPYATALQKLGVYEKRLVSCIHAISTGTFLKAGR